MPFSIPTPKNPASRTQFLTLPPQGPNTSAECQALPTTKNQSSTIHSNSFAIPTPCPTNPITGPCSTPNTTSQSRCCNTNITQSSHTVPTPIPTTSKSSTPISHNPNFSSTTRQSTLSPNNSTHTKPIPNPCPSPIPLYSTPSANPTAKFQSQSYNHIPPTSNLTNQHHSATGLTLSPSPHLPTTCHPISYCSSAPSPTPHLPPTCHSISHCSSAPPPSSEPLAIPPTPKSYPTTPLPVAIPHSPTPSHSPPSLPPPLKGSSFKFANISGLLSANGRLAKIPILTQDAKDENPLFMLFTESHLNDTAKEKEFYIPNYSNICSNRQNRSHGGVIIYLHNHLTYKTLCNASDEMCSFLSIYVNELKLILMLAYRPPPDYDHGHLYHGNHLHDSFSHTIINNINMTIQESGAPTPDIILAGDFNFPNAKWCEGTGYYPQGNSAESHMLRDLISVCDTHNLLQNITFGTRPTLAGDTNILDLLFTNNHQLISNISHYKSSISDHSIISCQTSYDHPLNISPNSPSPTPSSTLASFNLHRANFENINRSLSRVNWEELFQNKSETEIQVTFESKVLDIVELNCPKFTSRPGQSNNKIPRVRRVLYRQRKRKLKALRSSNCHSARRIQLENDVQQIERDLIASLKEERLNEEEKAISNIRTNPKYFYSFARKHQIVKGGIGPLKVDGTLINSPQEICEQLSSQYSSVFSHPDPNQNITDPLAFFTLTGSNSPSLTDIQFSPKMIEDEINSLKNNSAPGPDHFSVTLLKSCKKELSKPIYLMWRKSLDNSDIAQKYLHAIVCPVLKPGNESYHPKSYRPISLTSHIIKIFEKVMRKAIIKHLTDNQLLPSNQHGFLSGRSTLSQLLSQTETIIRALESRNDLDSVYLDFSKAFDKVDHSILCSKIKALGIGGKVGSWLHAFLTNRTQQVSANGSLSNTSPVLSGVPQGTVLGPILFIIMIADIDKNLVAAFASLFADDSRISAIIESLADSENFQGELKNIIYPWASSNKAKFNGDKFEHIHFGKNSATIPTYKDPEDRPIATKNCIKDLGVLISNDLCWDAHINKLISDCRRQMAWILRTFSKRDVSTMRSLWISLIRPIIDYCSPLWSPNPTNYCNIDRLESILRGYTKKVDGLSNKSYSERLKSMNLHSIQRRHERYKILYIYKIKEGLVPNLPPDPSNHESTFALKFHKSERNGTRCTIPNRTLYHNPAELPRSSSFALTASNLWNCLPPNISSISNIPVLSFKRRLDQFLDLFPDEPRCSASGQFSDPNTGRISNSLWHMRHNQLLRSNINNFYRIDSSQILSREGLDEVILHP